VSSSSDNQLPAGPSTKQDFLARLIEAQPDFVTALVSAVGSEREPDDLLLSLRQAAARANMGVSTLRQRLYAGTGPPALKSPGSNRWRFWRSEFDAWLEVGRVKTNVTQLHKASNNSSTSKALRGTNG
jgi:hypothetical protein